MVQHFWSADIETRFTFRPNKWMQANGAYANDAEDDDVDVKSKEKRIFLIRINGLNQAEQQVTFKIKTSLNNNLFSDDLNSFFANIYQEYMPYRKDFYWKCLHHGKNKRLALLLVGCDSYSGVLIVNENIYLVNPWSTPALKNQYKIELMNPITNYNLTTDEIVRKPMPPKLIWPQRITASTSTRSSSSSDRNYIKKDNYKKFNLKINLDKAMLNDYLLANTARLDDLIRHLTIKFHLVWSYYYHKLETNFQIQKIDLVNYSNLNNSDSNNRKLFNIDPNNFLNSNRTSSSFVQFKRPFELKKMFYTIKALSKPQAQTFIDIFEIPQYLLSSNEHLNGIATQSTVAYCNNQTYTPRASLILIKNTFDHMQTDTSRYLINTLEQANMLVELLGFNFGNIHKNPKNSCKNWFFNEIQFENEANLKSDNCVRKTIDVNRNCKSLKEIEEELFKLENHCGNGIVESELDEQCDCGGRNENSYQTSEKAIKNLESCNLKCCDMTTCRFRNSYMQCATGSCCNENCLFKSRNDLCRDVKNSNGSAISSCDFAEYCNGESSDCPLDRFAHDGTTCYDKINPSLSGYCYMGECKLGTNSQCKSIWSSESISSDLECYKKFNTIGFENGHCGIANNQSRTYTPCELQHAQCGLLNCQNGSEKPQIKTVAYAKSITNFKGNIQYECKVVPNPPIYVNDGSRCYSENLEHGICINKKCEKLNEIINPNKMLNKCISEINAKDISFKLCSNNGICDNEQICNCNTNYSGKYCEYFTDVESLNGPSGNIYNKSLSSNMGPDKNLPVLTIIGAVSLVCLLVFLFGFIFCRNRTSRKKRNPTKNIYTNENNQSKNSFMNASDNHFELSLTKVNLAIQKLKTQPSKSILKKVSDTTLVYAHSQTDLRDTSFQVNLNTLINAGLVECPQSQQLMRKNQVNESSSETSSIEEGSILVNNGKNNIGLVKNYSISISSSLSKYNEIEIPINPFKETSSYEDLDSKNIHDTTINNNYNKDLSLLTSNSSSTSETASLNNLSDASSLSLSERTLNSQTVDNLKVEDYLNELQHLSNQNSFALAKNYVLENDVEPLNVNTKTNSNHECNGVLHTNTSEASTASSGYLSYSAMNAINANNATLCVTNKNEPRSDRSISPANNEKRFSYILATGSSNNLNADSNDNG